MPGEGRRDLSGEWSLLPSPGPPPLILHRLSTLSNPSPQLSLKQFGGRTELEKSIFFSTDLEKTFSLLLVSHRETNAKGQPYKPPATPLTLTKIFEEDGVGFGEGKLSLESFPFPSPMLPITPQPSRPWRAPRRRRPLQAHRGRRRTRRRQWPRPRWSRP